MKSLYVAAVHRVRSLLRVVGVLGALDRWADRSRAGRWVRSLFSVYDLDDLVRQDVPWWTFEASDRVAEFLATRPGSRVFEWGSGASTVWLSRRAGSVTSVEHDADWSQLVEPMLPANAAVTVVPPVPATGAPDEARSAKPGFGGLDFASYVGVVDDVEGRFDLIVVDGRAREACFERAVSRLADGGVLVFDNVDRERYRAAIASSPVPVEVEWTRGLTPALPYPTRTALVRLRG